MDRISYRCALAWNPEDPTPLADDMITQFALPHGVIEIRHKGTYLEVSQQSTTGLKRFLIQPWVSNQIYLSIEPELPTQKG